MAATLNYTASEINTLLAKVENMYPVGSIYMSLTNTSPATLFGGTWEAIEGQFLLGANSTYTAGSTGGEATHILTTDEMPAHIHDHIQMVAGGTTYDMYYVNRADPGGGSYTSFDFNSSNAVFKTSSKGGDQAHNNMPPYLAVYMWKRTA